MRSLEHFLLTDVVVEQNDGVDVGSNDTNANEGAAAQDMSPKRTEISTSQVRPKTLRHRASEMDREEEEIACANVGGLVMEEPVAEEEENNGAAGDGTEGRVQRAQMGILPNDPTEFGVIVAIGAIFFRLIQGRHVDLQLDVLLLFGLSCGMIGYHLAVRSSSVVHVEKGMDQRTFIAIMGKSKSTHVVTPSPIKGKMGPRPSLYMIQKSLRNIRAPFTGEVEEEIEHVKKMKTIVAAPTLPRFPENSTTGSHSNCWSFPPCSSFKVRGANYL